ncbi:PH domain-containing protein [Aeromicrobium fastidiosum]|uniref:PH domain-containing protein n=1 Tax=Aeromicrobium fastidiosum TaxID=52699 RepID=A0A641AJB4_9ACTN|nr:PH domain-containing protein [Aeromicrobium fastidiosum]KAA1372440.1 PH domain-containing protein [Aeromicrobium fastidiosum]MBP2391486.1 membrane protein YdbS with pleckstrin-like domain [Aeromicrobium fastidiosum]
MDNLFAPAVGEWQRVSPRLATVRRILLSSAAAVVVLVGVVLVLVLPDLWWIGTPVAVIGLAGGVWGWTWAGRNQRSWGYAENADDLLVTRGVMFKRLVAIPYGRMQFVDVEAGPLDRAYGIATVTLHTASSETAADIPGLPAEEATRLRNRLTELGESRGAGL